MRRVQKLKRTTDELTAARNCIDGRQQVDSGSCFQNIAAPPGFEGFLYYVGRRLLGHEDDSGIWVTRQNLPSNFDSI